MTITYYLEERISLAKQRTIAAIVPKEAKAFSLTHPIKRIGR